MNRQATRPRWTSAAAAQHRKQGSESNAQRTRIVVICINTWITLSLTAGVHDLAPVVIVPVRESEGMARSRHRWSRHPLSAATGRSGGYSTVRRRRRRRVFGGQQLRRRQVGAHAPAPNHQHPATAAAAEAEPTRAV
jgi:hypothetical protein